MGFMDRMQETINQGLKTSRDLFGKAKEKAKDLGEIGVIKFEIMQLENQAEKHVAQLGSNVYRVLIEEEHNTVSRNTPDIKEVLGQIEDVKQQIEQKEADLKNMK
jgi:hypothetical protein